LPQNAGFGGKIFFFPKFTPKFDVQKCNKKPKFAKILRGGQKTLKFKQLFATERPKQRFTSRIFEKFAIFTIFKQNSPNFLPKSARNFGNSRILAKN
jgi:hypothetical protein